MAHHILQITEHGDPIQHLAWLTGVKEAVNRELDDELAKAYFEARIQGQFEQAVSVGPCSRKKALALTRRENNRRGRTVKWGDKADPSSSAYYH